MNTEEFEKTFKELLKYIIENNDAIPQRVKNDLKLIIEVNHNPEKIMSDILMYMLKYS